MEQDLSTEKGQPLNGGELFLTHSSINHKIVDISILHLDDKDRMKQAIKELSIGRRIREELRRQGRTVSWLARQLCMERTNLYYAFRQNSIDVELLLRISFFLNYDFFQDIVDVCKSYGLFNNK